MDVLLTWSGDASREVATVFRSWLEDVLPGIKPWISTEDIAKGKKWSDELTKQLDRSTTSITFITPDNVRSPWVYYEVGFIAAKLETALVCPYLIGVEGKHIKDTPLGQFQWTVPTKDDTWGLIRSINQQLRGKGHDENIIQVNFNNHWPKITRKVNQVIATLTPVRDEIIETEPSIEEQLSDEARQLLVEAASDARGVIMYVRTTTITGISTNGKNLIPEQTARCIATWVAALNELRDFSLVEDRGYKGSTFRITRSGYEVADLLKSRT